MVIELDDIPNGGPALMIYVLRKAGKPLTTRQVYEETRKLVPFCAFDNAVALNLIRLSGAIKGKREGGAWIWWIEDEEKAATASDHD